MIEAGTGSGGSGGQGRRYAQRMHFHEVGGCGRGICRGALCLRLQHVDGHLGFGFGCGGGDERCRRGRYGGRTWQWRDRRWWSGWCRRWWRRNRERCRDHLGAGGGDRCCIDHAGALLPIDGVVHCHAQRLQHHGIEHAERLCGCLTGGQRHDAAHRIDDLAVHATVVDHDEVAPFWMIKARI